MAVRRRVGLLVICLLGVGLLVWLGLFVHHRLRYAVTNAVFVENDRLVFLGFQGVSGRLVEVRREEGERVEEGELLAVLDERPWRERLRRLEARREALRMERERAAIALARLRREVRLREARAGEEVRRLEAEREALLAQVRALEARLEQLRRDRERFAALYRRRLVPKRRLEEVETELEGRERERAALLARAAALAAARRAAEQELLLARNRKRQVAEQERALARLERELEALSAAVEEARLNLSYCRLRAPFAGLVARRFHAAGDVVAPGEPVFALVDPEGFYVLVLLEETKLRGVVPGARARITLDAYPDRVFEGEVAEILPATAAKFALVPRDVSAGEFTKVVQRVPVKVRLTRGPRELLRVGLGGEVEIRRQ